LCSAVKVICFSLKAGAKVLPFTIQTKYFYVIFLSGNT
jgi:hypothetical protein